MSCGAPAGEPVPESGTTISPRLEDMQRQLYIPEPLRERMETAGKELEGENRLVTVLFADISGFTTLSQGFPTETVVEKVNECFRVVTDAVYRYEGSVNRFIGDCVLAFFGAPIAHENDPERAVLAALEMQKVVSDLDLDISVGINTGMVYFGPIGTEKHHEVSAYGPDVNLAKRLQESAQPGQIRVGCETHRLTRRAFEFETLPPLTLKGVAEPVSSYQVVKVLPRPEKMRGLEGLKAPMVGRDEEFAKVTGCLEELMEGRGQILSIIGVAGVGKSRLVSELEAKAQSIKSAVSPLWLEGRCLSIGETVGYWVFIDLLKSFFSFESTEEQTAMGKKLATMVEELLPNQPDEVLPPLGHLLSVKFGNEWDERLKTATPEQMKHRTFMALRDFFLALARRRPLILVLEDLHWADDLSLDLVSLLMEVLTLAPLMLVCIYRPEQEHKSWHLSTVASKKCPDRYMELRLRELRPQESRRLVEELLRIENLTERVKELILEKAEGNPFFVEEVIRSLVDSGVVYREGDKWKARAEIESLTVPDTIQSVIMSRIDCLEEDVKDVLQCAAVIGRLFRHRLLSYMSQRGEELDRYLWQLEDKELIYEERAVPEVEYSFKHVLTQETAYQSLSKRRREAFHQKVAEALEEIHEGSLEECYEQLTHHWFRVGNWAKALEYAREAGQKAYAAYARREAIELFGLALEAAEKLGESAPDVHLQRALSYDGIDFLRGVDELAHMEAIGRASGDVSTLAEALAWKGWMHIWGGGLLKEAFQEADESLAIAREHKLREVQARALSVHGWVHIARGNLVAAEEVSRESAQLANESELGVNIWLLHFQGKEQSAVDFAEKLLGKMSRLHLAFGIHLCRFVLGLANAALGNYERALFHLQQGYDLSVEQDEMTMRARHGNTIGHVYLLLGMREKSLDWNQRSMEMGTAFGDWELAGNCLVNLGELYLDEDPGEARRLLDQAYNELEENEFFRWRHQTRLFYQYGRLELALGRREKALEWAEKVREMTEITSAPKNVVRADKLTGEIYLADAQWEGAARYLRSALEGAQKLKNPNLTWEVAAGLGRALVELGERGEAMTLYKDGLRLAEEVAGRLTDENLRKVLLASSPITTLRRDLERLE